VSIIVPVYNVENYLSECINSILNQTLVDLEIICIDDCSTDNSLKILSDYSKEDPRIKIIRHQKNQGLGGARNTGLLHATSPFTAFVDSDDYIDRNMIECLYDSATENQTDMAWCGISKFVVNGVLLDDSELPEKNWKVEEVLKCGELYPSILTLCNKLFRTEIIKQIKQLPIVSEDQPVMAEYLTKINSITTIKNNLYFYRQREDSISNPNSYSVKQWDYFFFAHSTFIQILNKRFSLDQLREQIVLRHFSMLWRLKNFGLLTADNYLAHETKILELLRTDVLSLKKASPIFYRFLALTLRPQLSRATKKALVNLGMELSRTKWLRHKSTIYLPFDLISGLVPRLKLFIKSSLDIFEIGFVKTIAKIYQLTHKEVWLVGERGDTAEDNGIYFYNYLKKNKPYLNFYFIIDKKSPQYNSLKNDTSIVQPNSLRHKILFQSCKYYVTSHNHFCFPLTYLQKERYVLPKRTENVFLDHGITYANVSEFYGKENSKITLFICGAKPEYDYVLKEFGYQQNEVVYTGFARFDGLHDFKTQKTILVMPTWRRDLYEIRDYKNETKEQSFKNSEYYKRFQSLLNNQQVHELLSKFNYKLIFYPHYEIQRYLSFFSTQSENIVIASKTNYNVQRLLMDANLLITDTSSVNFDFAYMKKPVLYYFFDKNIFTKRHLKQGYFNHSEDGFGEVINNEERLIEKIDHLLSKDCQMDQVYKVRSDNFFPLFDQENCSRIFQSIVNKKNQLVQV
jgi:glycosyltransferase involved in cell wall biosynthesis